MAESQYNYVKTIVQSLLSSSPKTMTISEILSDYIKLEGNVIPYKELGFISVYALLNSMNDIIEVSEFKY